MKVKRSTKRLGYALLLVLIMAIVAWVVFRKQSTTTGLVAPDWTGEWAVSFYYDNEPSLIFNGDLRLTFSDSLEGTLELDLPKSSRKANFPLKELQLSAGAASLQGLLTHTSYKIRGGYLQEFFELQLISPDSLVGKGHCLEFCAEGTEGIPIIWRGKRTL